MVVETDIFIDALEDSTIIEFDMAQIDHFLHSNEHQKALISRLFRRIATLQRRVILLMSAPASRRYEHFVQTYPQLINRVPQKMIASYLGITPQALSNIKRKLRFTET